MDDVRRPDGQHQEGRLQRRGPPQRELSAEAKRWQEENRAAIDEFNRWYATNGSPLDQYRRF